MAKLIVVVTPDGQKHRHVSSLQNGDVEWRTRPDGDDVEVLGVVDRPELKGHLGGSVVRPASRTEKVLATYPAGSHVEVRLP